VRFSPIESMTAADGLVHDHPAGAPALRLADFVDAQRDFA